MHVDEARRDDEPVGVERLARVPRDPTDVGDNAIGDRQVGRARRAARTVDDEPTQLADLARLLRGAPAVREVECAGDGHDALVKASAQLYDAIFLDVRMPDLDGLELGRVLRRFAVAPQLVFVSATPGAYFWTGVTFAGIAYNKSKVKPEEAPKTYKDLLNPRWRNKMSCKISASGIQYVQWYLLRNMYGADFWKQYSTQKPRAFDSRVQLFDRLSKGDDDITSMAEYAAYILYKARGAEVAFVAPPEGLVATPLIIGAVSKAPHPEAAKLFVDWAMSNRGQKYYQDHPNLYYGSVRDNPPPMPTGEKLSAYKLIFPTDWDDYGKQREVFNKEWNAMFGL